VNERLMMGDLRSLVENESAYLAVVCDDRLGIIEIANFLELKLHEVASRVERRTRGDHEGSEGEHVAAPSPWKGKKRDRGDGHQNGKPLRERPDEVVPHRRREVKNHASDRHQGVTP